MLLSGPFEKFVEPSPVSVIMRGIIENLLHPERLERIFEENAVSQYKCNKGTWYSRCAVVVSGRVVETVGRGIRGLR